MANSYVDQQTTAFQWTQRAGHGWIAELATIHREYVRKIRDTKPRGDIFNLVQPALTFLARHEKSS